MRLSLIVAVDRNGLIGTETGLPWHLPADLRRFRDLTMGKPIIMGRTTHNHIARPLPGRLNLVLSRSAALIAGCTVARSLDDAIRIAEEVAEEAFVIGGASLYREAIPRTDRIHLTVVDGKFEGSTYFPREFLGTGAWTIRQREVCAADSKNAYRHLYLVLERCLPKGASGTAFDLPSTLTEPFA
jgi:dihydrofolate reductase